MEISLLLFYYVTVVYDKDIKTAGEQFYQNVGSVRFELTIDGSLRHASVLQRVITQHRNSDELPDALSG